MSTHTLVAAAYEILRGINRERKAAPMIKDWAPDYVRPERKREFGQRLNEAQNFFKHAYPNPSGTLTFDTGQTEILLLDACWTYRRLSRERLPLLGVYETWAAATWARDLVTYDGVESLDPRFIQRISKLSRHEFFAELLPIAYESWVERPDA